MAHKTDAEMVQHTHNTARFFVENRQIAWVLLIGTVLWGWYRLPLTCRSARIRTFRCAWRWH